VADPLDVEAAELQAIVARDQDAFSHWFARCEIKLRRSLRSFAQVTDVEAVVQDTALRVWQRASTIRPDGRPECILRWAVTVALNAARNEAKRSGHQLPLGPTVEGLAHSTTNMPDPVLRVRIQSCRERLGATPRLVLDAQLTDAGQHSSRELAMTLGMTADAVRQNLVRARRALQRCLRTFGIDLRDYLK
jgi:RNA polymerase sigma factor (sigma-70 family)